MVSFWFGFGFDFKIIFGLFFSAEVSEDSSLLAVGFADSMVRVWSLLPLKLREMKGSDLLKDIDRDAGKQIFF